MKIEQTIQKKLVKGIYRGVLKRYDTEMLLTGK